MAARQVREVDDFRFRRLDKPEEFRAVEEVGSAAASGAPEPALSAPVLRLVQDHGGMVLGALADIHLAGFTAGFLGWDGAMLYHFAVATAVRPEYQNHRVGFRLKAFQRDEVLRQGLTEVRGTFDPLQSRTAMLLVRQLGVVPERYFPHYFGRVGSGDDEARETDRVGYRWELANPSVVARMEGKVPTPEQDAERWRTSTPILESDVGALGLRQPTSVVEPTEARAHVEIPFDLDLIRTHEPANLRKWRHALRDGLRGALDLGYRVTDFAVLTLDHERRSFYFLERPASVHAPPTRTGVASREDG